VTFEILEPGPNKTSVLTGHNDGLITINAAESDPVERLTRREAMEEPYRTLLGHFRHESGHYYWQHLVQSDPVSVEDFRANFGDERVDYAESLEKHYRDGPSADWQSAFISSYAASHPWEDFAETWAHYLHIIDALDLAESWGLALTNYPPSEMAAFSSQSSGHIEFDGLLGQWLPVALFANSLNRSFGHDDAYPFAPAAPVNRKLAWIHGLVARVFAGTPA